MGATKTSQYTDKQITLAQLAKALGHPARVAIVDYLLSVEACICNDITDQLQLAQPTVSQHLKELKSAGLIKGSIDRNSICYCINEKAIGVLQQYLAAVSGKLSAKTICC